MLFLIKVEISIHLWLACRRSDEVVDDLDGDRGCDIEVEDEMEAIGRRKNSFKNAWIGHQVPACVLNYLFF